MRVRCHGRSNRSQRSHSPSAQPPFPPFLPFNNPSSPSRPPRPISHLAGSTLWWSPAAASSRSPFSSHTCTLCLQVPDHSSSLLRHTVYTTLLNKRTHRFWATLGSDATWCQMVRITSPRTAMTSVINLNMSLLCTRGAWSVA